MNADKDTYIRILENRPFKLSPAEADYKAAEGKEKCGSGCVHFFVRKADGFNVCEVVRPTEENEESIIPNYQCKFWTDDMENYPLLDE